MLPVASTPLEEDVEIDEFWSFVGSKANPCWLWTVLCRRTRQVLCYALGKRDIGTGQRLWQSVCGLPGALSLYRYSSVHTDAHDMYDSIVPPKQHWPTDADGGKGGTNHLERFHLTVRQRLGRFVRKTLSFSKSQEMHEATLKLFFHRYNLERRQLYLQATLQQH